jgi:hypothetical protein
VGSDRPVGTDDFQAVSIERDLQVLITHPRTVQERRTSLEHWERKGHTIRGDHTDDQGLNGKSRIDGANWKYGAVPIWECRLT